jgi:hypothetical protein
MSRPVRRVALFGYLGSGNLGSDATFETVLGWVKTTQPDIVVRGLTTAPDELTARYGVPAVSFAWHSSRTADNRIMEASRKLLGRLLDAPRSSKLAGSLDAVIIHGMGVLEATFGVRPWGMPLEAYSRDLKEVDPCWLVARVRAAREEAGSLTNQIQRGTSEYTDEVESLLQQVAGDALGVTPRPWHRPDIHEEIGAWHVSYR